MNRPALYSHVRMQRGYVALMSALIVSALLMMLVFAANSDAFIARTDLSHAEDHLQAKHFANACGSIALRILTLDSGRLSSSTPLKIQLDEHATCSIISGTVSGNTAETAVRARSGNSISLVRIHASRASSTATFIPTYWSETQPE